MADVVAPRLLRRHYLLLGMVLGAEAGGRIYQARGPVTIGELEQAGMVERVSARLPPRFPRELPVMVDGWALTERGRITYCEWAAGQPDD